jgi:glycosyltransferase EpsF
MIKNFLKKFSKKYATTYLACGENAGRYQFGDKTFDEGKVFVLRNAIDIDRFAFNEVDRKKIREELGIKEDEILVGTIGRLCQQKNHQYLLKIAALLPQVKFVIVGAGPLEEEDKAFIKDNKLDNVIMYGVSMEAYRFYSAFDTFVLPSLYEGLPVTGVEAQTNGVYTLFSDQVSKEAQASSYLKFLPIEDKDIPLWVNELKIKHPHENHLDEVIKSGFSIKESSQDLLKLYQSLLEK